MTDNDGNLLWYGEYTAWDRLKEDERIYRTRISRSDFKTSTLMKRPACISTSSGIMRLMRLGLSTKTRLGCGSGLIFYWFAPNVQGSVDPLGLAKKNRWAYYHYMAIFDKAGKMKNVTDFKFK